MTAATNLDQASALYQQLLLVQRALAVLGANGHGVGVVIHDPDNRPHDFVVRVNIPTNALTNLLTNLQTSLQTQLTNLGVT